ncbi:hypothetical protein BT69DRAFT_1296161 [Atractiella rhizophila]|nr:hypothetical protein BT69DRAFT_1296161 [Atractiella rhizophila]
MAGDCARDVDGMEDMEFIEVPVNQGFADGVVLGGNVKVKSCESLVVVVVGLNSALMENAGSKSDQLFLFDGQGKKIKKAFEHITLWLPPLRIKKDIFVYDMPTQNNIKRMSSFSQLQTLPTLLQTLPLCHQAFLLRLFIAQIVCFEKQETRLVMEACFWHLLVALREIIQILKIWINPLLPSTQQLMQEMLFSVPPQDNNPKFGFDQDQDQEMRAQQAWQELWTEQTEDERDTAFMEKILGLQDHLTNRFSDPDMNLKSFLIETEDSSEVVKEMWQSSKWREELDAEFLSPSIHVRGSLFFVNKLAQLVDGSYFLPSCGFLLGSAKTLCARGLYLDHNRTGGWIIMEEEKEVPVVAFEANITTTELLEGVVEQLNNYWSNGIISYDDISGEELLLRSMVIVFEGDNPMQAEACSCSPSLGVSLKFCRVCKVGEEKKGDQLTETGITNFMKIGQARSMNETKAKAQEINLLAANPRSKTRVINEQRKSGVRDPIVSHFAEELLQLALQENQLSRKWHYNPLFDLQAFDCHRDTPFEILHGILLGFVKYFWRDSISGLSEEQKILVSKRLSAADPNGLGRVRHIFSGGFWKDNITGKWVQAGNGVRGLFRNLKVHLLLGLAIDMDTLEPRDRTGEIKVASQLKQTVKAKDTQLAQIPSSAHLITSLSGNGASFTQFSHQLVSSVIINKDKPIQVGSWVTTTALDDNGRPIIARVMEILKLEQRDGDAAGPRTMLSILIRSNLCAPTSTCQFLLQSTGEAAVHQERQLSTKRKAIIEHQHNTTKDLWILNTNDFCNSDTTDPFYNPLLLDNRSEVITKSLERYKRLKDAEMTLSKARKSLQAGGGQILVDGIDISGLNYTDPTFDCSSPTIPQLRAILALYGVTAAKGKLKLTEKLAQEREHALEEQDRAEPEYGMQEGGAEEDMVVGGYNSIQQCDSLHE